ncbi:hypothetical protein HPB48_021123 [Haemaphysalis longicornis]|uniref:Uncharacterized protein n=1 Tax=Haemaphysalis longicornis TaxID=44386 RepID=A0A9J6GPA7_HAELO|nr:hypothetical protein HPB48_021123 [Haemaphysalis longicornis]
MLYRIQSFVSWLPENSNHPTHRLLDGRLRWLNRSVGRTGEHLAWSSSADGGTSEYTFGEECEEKTLLAQSDRLVSGGHDSGLNGNVSGAEEYECVSGGSDIQSEVLSERKMEYNLKMAKERWKTLIWISLLRIGPLDRVSYAQLAVRLRATVAVHDRPEMQAVREGSDCRHCADDERLTAA